MKQPTSRGASTGEQAGGVLGERSIPAVVRTLSVQARINNLLALGLMLLVAGGMLIWYYSHQLARQSRARQGAQSDVTRLAASEMALPPLGPIEPLRLMPVESKAKAYDQGASSDAAHNPSGPLIPVPVSALPVAARVPPALLLQPAASTVTGSGLAAGSSAAPFHPPSDRRLLGPAFVTATTVAQAQAPSAAADATGAVDADSTASAITVPSPAERGAAPANSPISQTGGSTAVSVDHLLASGSSVPHLLPTQSLVLPKGAFIDCTLETAIDSTLPGLTSCITATDTFGADGRVILLERGTKLVGETQGQVQQGSARVFVLWSEARTPLGVIVPLESPGADELGRSGLAGTVQRHFWERFGAAIMVSTIDGAVQAAVQSSSRNGGTVIYNPGAAPDVMTEILKSTVAIPPTVVKRNGDRIEVLVARDVDFRAVYALRDTRYER